jgi:hypothetical protein
MRTIVDHLALMCIASVILATTANPAHAYIGPGAGLGAIALTVALGLGGMFLLVGLGWYPLKRLFKKIKSSSKR